MNDKQLNIDLLWDEILDEKTINKIRLADIWVFNAFYLGKKRFIDVNEQNLSKRMENSKNITIKGHNAYNEKKGYIVLIRKLDQFLIKNVGNFKNDDINARLKKYYATFDEKLGLWFKDKTLYIEIPEIVENIQEAIERCLQYGQQYIYDLRNQKFVSLKTYKSENDIE